MSISALSACASLSTVTKALAYDIGLPELNLLLDGVDPSYKLIPISSHDDAIDKISNIVSQKQWHELAILCHGSSDSLKIGSENINSLSISRRVDQINSWNVESISLYSCNAGKNSKLLKALSTMTNAHIFASSNKVGSTAKGGNWTLDVHQSPPTSPFGESRELWQHTLVDIELSPGDDLEAHSDFDGDNNLTLIGAFDATDIRDYASLTTGDIDGSGITEINGSAENILAAYDQLAEVPDDFSATFFSGTAAASDVNDIADIGTISSVDGSLLTSLSGASTDIASALTNLGDNAPSAFNIYFSDNSVASEVIDLSNSNGGGTLFATSLSSITGASDDMLEALGALNSSSLPSSYTVIITSADDATDVSTIAGTYTGATINGSSLASIDGSVEDILSALENVSGASGFTSTFTADSTASAANIATLTDSVADGGYAAVVDGSNLGTITGTAEAVVSALASLDEAGTEFAVTLTENSSASAANIATLTDSVADGGYAAVVDGSGLGAITGTAEAVVSALASLDSAGTGFAVTLTENSTASISDLSTLTYPVANGGTYAAVVNGSGLATLGSGTTSEVLTALALLDQAPTGFSLTLTADSSSSASNISTLTSSVDDGGYAAVVDGSGLGTITGTAEAVVSALESLDSAGSEFNVGLGVGSTASATNIAILTDAVADGGYAANVVGGALGTITGTAENVVSALGSFADAVVGINVTLDSGSTASLDDISALTSTAADGGYAAVVNGSGITTIGSGTASEVISALESLGTAPTGFSLALTADSTASADNIATLTDAVADGGSYAAIVDGSNLGTITGTADAVVSALASLDSAGTGFAVTLTEDSTASAANIATLTDTVIDGGYAAVVDGSNLGTITGTADAVVSALDSLDSAGTGFAVTLTENSSASAANIATLTDAVADGGSYAAVVDGSDLATITGTADAVVSALDSLDSAGTGFAVTLTENSSASAANIATLTDAIADGGTYAAVVDGSDLATITGTADAVVSALESLDSAGTGFAVTLTADSSASAAKIATLTDAVADGGTYAAVVDGSNLATITGTADTVVSALESLDSAGTGFAVTLTAGSTASAAKIATLTDAIADGGTYAAVVDGSILGTITGTADAVVSALESLDDAGTGFAVTLTSDSSASAAKITTLTDSIIDGGYAAVVDGSGLSDINGNADDVLAAYLSLDTAPQSFSSALTGTNSATAISTLYHDHSATLDGSDLTTITGTASQVIDAYQDLSAPRPTNYTAVLSGTATTDQLSIIDSNYSADINGENLDAISGTASAVVAALTSFDSAGTGFAVTLNENSSASAADIATLTDAVADGGSYAAVVDGSNLATITGTAEAVVSALESLDSAGTGFAVTLTENSSASAANIATLTDAVADGGSYEAVVDGSNLATITGTAEAVVSALASLDEAGTEFAVTLTENSTASAANIATLTDAVANGGNYEAVVDGSSLGTITGTAEAVVSALESLDEAGTEFAVTLTENSSASAANITALTDAVANGGIYAAVVDGSNLGAITGTADAVVSALASLDSAGNGFAVTLTEDSTASAANIATLTDAVADGGYAAVVDGSNLATITGTADAVVSALESLDSAGTGFAVTLTAGSTASAAKIATLTDAVADGGYAAVVDGAILGTITGTAEAVVSALESLDSAGMGFAVTLTENSSASAANIATLTDAVADDDYAAVVDGSNIGTITGTADAVISALASLDEAGTGFAVTLTENSSASAANIATLTDAVADGGTYAAVVDGSNLGTITGTADAVVSALDSLDSAGTGFAVTLTENSSASAANIATLTDAVADGGTYAAVVDGSNLATITGTADAVVSALASLDSAGTGFAVTLTADSSASAANIATLTDAVADGGTYAAVVDGSNLATITGTAEAVVSALASLDSAGTEFAVTLTENSSASAANIATLANAVADGGTYAAVVDGSNIGTITGTAANILTTYNDLLNEKPASFNAEISGVTNPVEIEQIDLINGGGTIDGSGITQLDGSIADIINALLILSENPDSFSSTLAEGTGSASNINTIAEAGTLVSFDGSQLTAINGTAAEIVNALDSFTVDPTSFTSTLTADSTASAANIATLTDAVADGGYAAVVDGSNLATITGTAEAVVSALASLDSAGNGFDVTLTENSSASAANIATLTDAVADGGYAAVVDGSNLATITGTADAVISALASLDSAGTGFAVTLTENSSASAANIATLTDAIADGGTYAAVVDGSDLATITGTADAVVSALASLDSAGTEFAVTLTENSSASAANIATLTDAVADGGTYAAVVDGSNLATITGTADAVVSALESLDSAGTEFAVTLTENSSASAANIATLTDAVADGGYAAVVDGSNLATITGTAGAVVSALDSLDSAGTGFAVTLTENSSASAANIATLTDAVADGGSYAAVVDGSDLATITGTAEAVVSALESLDSAGTGFAVTLTTNSTASAANIATLTNDFRDNGNGDLVDGYRAVVDGSNLATITGTAGDVISALESLDSAGTGFAVTLTENSTSTAANITTLTNAIADGGTYAAVVDGSNLGRITGSASDIISALESLDSAGTGFAAAFIEDSSASAADIATLTDAIADGGSYAAVVNGSNLGAITGTADAVISALASLDSAGTGFAVTLTENSSASAANIATLTDAVADGGYAAVVDGSNLATITGTAEAVVSALASLDSAGNGFAVTLSTNSTASAANIATLTDAVADGGYAAVVDGSGLSNISTATADAAVAALASLDETPLVVDGVIEGSADASQITTLKDTYNMVIDGRQISRINGTAEAILAALADVNQIPTGFDSTLTAGSTASAANIATLTDAIADGGSYAAVVDGSNLATITGTANAVVSALESLDSAGTGFAVTLTADSSASAANIATLTDAVADGGTYAAVVDGSNLATITGTADAVVSALESLDSAGTGFAVTLTENSSASAAKIATLTDAIADGGSYAAVVDGSNLATIAGTAEAVVSALDSLDSAGTGFAVTLTADSSASAANIATLTDAVADGGSYAAVVDGSNLATIAGTADAVVSALDSLDSAGTGFAVTLTENSSASAANIATLTDAVADGGTYAAVVDGSNLATITGTADAVVSALESLDSAGTGFAVTLTENSSASAAKIATLTDAIADGGTYAAVVDGSNLGAITGTADAVVSALESLDAAGTGFAVTLTENSSASAAKIATLTDAIADGGTYAAVVDGSNLGAITGTADAVVSALESLDSAGTGFAVTLTADSSASATKIATLTDAIADGGTYAAVVDGSNLATITGTADAVVSALESLDSAGTGFAVTLIPLSSASAANIATLTNAVADGGYAAVVDGSDLITITGTADAVVSALESLDAAGTGFAVTLTADSSASAAKIATLTDAIADGGTYAAVVDGSDLATITGTADAVVSALDSLDSAGTGFAVTLTADSSASAANIATLTDAIADGGTYAAVVDGSDLATITGTADAVVSALDSLDAAGTGFAVTLTADSSASAANIATLTDAIADGGTYAAVVDGSNLGAITGTADAVVSALASLDSAGTGFAVTLTADSSASAANIATLTDAIADGGTYAAVVDGSNLGAITGTADAVVSALASLDAAGTGFAVTLTADSSASAANIATLTDAIADGGSYAAVVDGSGLIDIDGTASAVVAAYDSLDSQPASFDSDINGEATASAINDILTSNGSGSVDATDVTTITGSSSVLESVLQSGDILGMGSQDLSVSDFSITVNTANTLAGLTTGSISATIIAASASDLASLNETNHDYTITVLAGSADASNLSSISSVTTGTIHADAVSGISGSASDIASVFTASNFSNLSDSLDITISGNPSLDQITSIRNYTSGTVSYASISDSISALTEEVNSGSSIAASTNLIISDNASLAQIEHLDNNANTITPSSITDTASNLASNTGSYVTGTVNVTVSDAASVSQIGTISGYTDGTVTYTSAGITDSASNLATDAATNDGAGTYVTSGINVTVDGAASLAQLSTIDTAAATVTYTTVSDTASNLATNTGSYVTGIVNVTVSDAASVSQIGTISGYTDGTVTYTSAGITDSASNLATDAATNDGAGTYVTSGINVTVDGAASIEQLTNIDAAADDVTYTSIADTASNLATNTGNYVTGTINVTVSDAASVSQIGTISGYTDGTVTYSSAGITDSASNLATDAATNDGAGTYVTSGIDVTVDGSASIGQLTTIDAAADGVAYTLISDSASNLAANSGGYITGTIDVTVSDAASVSQIGTISGHTDGTVTYTSAGVTDSASNLATDAATNDGSGTYVTSGINVTVDGTASLAQLSTIDTAAATVTYTTVSDTASNLATNTGSYVTGTVNVTVSDAASVSQIGTISGYTDGTVTYTSAGITDSASNLATDAATNDGAGTYVTSGISVTVDGTASIDQLTNIDAAADDVTYTSIADTANNLATNTGSYVTGTVNVTVSDAASISEVAAINGYTSGTVNYTSAGITDNAANLATNSGGYINGSINVTVSDAASVSQIGTISGYTDGTITYTSAGITDSASNLATDAATNDGSGTYVTSGINVTVDGAASLAQLSTIDTAAATVTYTTVSDTASNLATNTGSYVTGNVNVIVSDAASVSQIGTISGYTDGTVTYTSAGITDSASNLATDAATNDGAGTYVTSGINVTVDGAASIDQLTNIDAAADDVTYTSIADTASNLATNTGSYVTGTVNVTVSDAVSISEVAAINGYTSGTVNYNSAGITDNAANLATNSGGYINGSINVTVSDAASVSQIGTISGYTDGTVTYTSAGITDSASNLATDAATNNGAGTYVTSGIDVTVDGAASLAQLSTIDTAAATVTYTTVSDTASNLATNTGSYVTGTVNVSVSDAASVSQIGTISGYTDGTVTYTSAGITDSASNLATDAATNDGAGTYVTSGINVTVDGAASIEQLTNIDAAADDVTYTSIADTASNLVTNTGSYVNGTVNVTISDAVSISEVAAINGYTSGTVNYTSAGITDNAANLTTNSGGYINGSINVTVSDAASVSQIGTISGYTDGTVTYTSAGITDSASNLATDAATNDGAGTYVTSGIDVTVDGAASIEQLTNIGAAADDVTYTSIADTANNLATNTGSYVTGTVNVTVSDAASVSQIGTISGYTDGTVTYTSAGITDSASNLATDAATNNGAGTYVTSGINVTVDGAASIDQLTNIDAAADDVTYTSIADTASNLATNTGNYVAAGKNITVTNTASISQLASIDAANTNGSFTYTSITDSAMLLANNAGNYVSGSTDVIVSNAATIEQMMLISGSTAGDVTFSIASSEATDGAIGINSSTEFEAIQNASNFDDFSYIFNGGSGDDSYTGGAQADIFEGGEGNDTLSGGGGTDVLNGGSGKDIIIGGSGNDVITGGSGRDQLSGGSGKDSFLFNNTKVSTFKKYDSITDLNTKKDSIIGFNGTDSSITNINDSITSYKKSSVKRLLKNNNLKADKAYTFTVDNTEQTFLYINDSNKSVSFKKDIFVDITGYSGNITKLVIG